MAPARLLAYWQARLAAAGVQTGALETRFGETVLPFRDPHGLQLALVEIAEDRPFVPWAEGPVPAEHQLRGMHLVRLWERDLALTEMLLTRGLGFTFVGEENGWRRFGVDGGGSGQLVELKALPAERRGAWGTGGVHHVAWRVRDNAEEMELREVLAKVGLSPTAPIDRFWFQSVYFREPGGFGRDEDMAHLGEQLILPPWLEGQRAEIEAGLTPLVMPALRAGAQS